MLNKEQEIMLAVQYHHDLVESKGYHVVMTSLVGSQNYNLDTEASDIDTFSFIFPSLEDLARAESPKAGIIFAEDGHCNFKDIRVALGLLKKTSPNSLEYFVSKYKVYNPVYKDILNEYLDNDTVLWSMIHCNYKHMLDAIAGMANQLTKRNMPAGKRFSHALRLDNMIYHFFNSNEPRNVLDLMWRGDRELALQAKLDKNEENDTFYNSECNQIARKLSIYSNTWNTDDLHKQIEETGLKLINKFQMELFQKYLMETNK